MDMWNLPINGAHLHELFAACDADANGTIDYNEFVDNLARDTVAPAAMGKRGTQTGADDQEMMEVMLGHVKHKNFALPEFAGVQKALTRADIVAMGKEKEAKAVKDQAMNQLNLHFTNMRKAFHFGARPHTHMLRGALSGVAHLTACGSGCAAVQTLSRLLAPTTPPLHSEKQSRKIRAQSSTAHTVSLIIPA